MEKKPELLAPAGDWISLKAALDAKADAIYFGIKGFNMRVNTQNFSISDIKKVVGLCHKNKVKSYLAINTIIYDNETKEVEKILKKAKDAGIDAIIAWDFSVLKLCNSLGLRIHLSTQGSVSNYESAEYYYRVFKVKRIVLARECTLEDIKKIIMKISKNKLNLEIEAFVHGAMCVSVSGRCFMSQFLFNKSANRGDCLQPCRRGYLVKDPEENHELEITNNYIMSPKDLCTLPFLDLLIDAGINSFKIEGRNRSPEYVKTVVECYREFIDFYHSVKNNVKDKSNLNQELKKKKDELVEKLKTVYNRGFSQGFFMGRPIEEWTDAYGSKATTRKIYLGKVINYFPKQSAAEIKIESEKLAIGDLIMVQGETTGIFTQIVDSMEKNSLKVDFAQKGTAVGIKTIEKVRKNDKVYIIREVAY